MYSRLFNCKVFNVSTNIVYEIILLQLIITKFQTNCILSLARKSNLSFIKIRTCVNKLTWNEPVTQNLIAFKRHEWEPFHLPDTENRKIFRHIVFLNKSQHGKSAANGSDVMKAV